MTATDAQWSSEVAEFRIGENFESPLGDLCLQGTFTDKHQGLFAQLQAGDEYEVLPFVEFVLRMSNFQRSKGVGPQPYAALMANMTAEQRHMYLQREQDVVDVRDGRPDYEGADPRYLATVSKRVRRDHKARERRVHHSTVNRWVNLYTAAGGISGLFHGKFAEPTNVLDRISGPVLAVLQAHVQRERASSRKSVENHHAMVLDDLRRAGLARSATNTIDAAGAPLPDAWELLNGKVFREAYRALRGNAPSSQDAKTSQSQRNRPSGTGVKHNGFGFADVVMVDATPVDIEVQGPDGPFRPHALFAICVATNYRWLRLCPHKPTGRDLALLLHDMINPQPFGTRAHGYQSIPVVPRSMRVNAWPPQPGDVAPAAIPGIIIADHGSEEENDHFISVVARLAIQIEWARSMSPTDKAKVEADIRTFALDCQLLPGHIGNSVKNSPSQRGGTARLTFDTLNRALSAWPFWAGARPHSGLKHPLYRDRYMTPTEAVHLSLSYGAPLRYSLNPTLPVEFLPRAHLTPATYGVEFKNTVFVASSSEEWQLLLSHSHGMGINGRSRKLHFYYDPYDISRLLWIVPDEMRAVTLYAPGADGGVVAPLDDLLMDRYVTVPGVSAPSVKTRVTNRADLVGFMRDIAASDLAGAVGLPASETKRPSVKRKSADSAMVTDLGIDGDLFGDDFADIDEEEFGL